MFQLSPISLIKYLKEIILKILYNEDFCWYTVSVVFLVFDVEVGACFKTLK